MHGTRTAIDQENLGYSPYSLSLDTLIGTSTLLGHELEACNLIREQQDSSLFHDVSSKSSVRLRNLAQQKLFAVAPLDILVTDAGGSKKFHIIELNGTGIGGLTNLRFDAVNAVMASMEQMTTFIDKDNPLIIVGSSGIESEAAPRLNKQVYEKLLYADAIRAGYMKRYGKAVVTTMSQALCKPEILAQNGPTVIVGYMKEFLNALACRDGRLYIGDRQVDGIVNDRMCLNFFHAFNYQVDLRQLLTMNRSYLAGADKGVAYALLNDYLLANPNPYFPKGVFYFHARSRQELISAVLETVRLGRKIVIKPRGTGLGHGIEFFLDEKESDDAMIKRIDKSLQITEQFYGLKGGALPYTLCEFVDTSMITLKDHPMYGHKYELRVVVYRDGMDLKAFPSIVKMSSQAFDPLNIDRMMLINNVSASMGRTKRAGINFKLPLCNWQTLDMLGLRREHLEAICEVATGYVRTILDRIQNKPEDLGLPASDAYQELPPNFFLLDNSMAGFN